MVGKKQNTGVSVRRERLCIVMACDDAAEAAHAGQALSKVNSGLLVAYRMAGEIMLNLPAGQVVLVILAGPDDPQTVERTLKWMRHRWSHCPLAVIGSGGNRTLEMAARRGGASYLVRPVSEQTWEAMIDHAFGKHAISSRTRNRGQLAAEEPKPSQVRSDEPQTRGPQSTMWPGRS